MPFFSKQPNRRNVLLTLLTGISLVILLLLGLLDTIEQESDEQKMTNPLHTPSASISHLDFYSDTFVKSIDLSLVVETNNLSVHDEPLYIGFSIVSPTNEVIDLPIQPIYLKGETDQALTLSYLLEDLKIDSILGGSYDAIVAIWDKSPIDNKSTQLDRSVVNDAFRLYNTIEHFKAIDKDLWHSRNGRLGRTQLKNEHVDIIDDMLTITHPAGTLECGEIQTIDLQHYGSYEICMKLPSTPSSITGFFLYSPPDFYHEIDIELFNQPDSEVWFTSYLDGSVHHEDKMALDFDPTADFHKYRIDYYPHGVTFYIDGNPAKSWEDGFPHEPMHLMVNSWFPNWLPGREPDENQSLQIKWIKY